MTKVSREDLEHGNIFPRLITEEDENYDPELFPEVFPNRELAGIHLYYCLKRDYEFFVITNEMLEDTGLTEEAVFERMCDCNFEDIFELHDVDPDWTDDTGFYCARVVSKFDVNKMSAAVIFFPGVLEELADNLGGSYFVLPSSKEEILALKDLDTLTRERDEMRVEELERMVFDINRSAVEEYLRLSDRVFYYNAVNHEFGLASEIREEF